MRHGGLLEHTEAHIGALRRAPDCSSDLRVPLRDRALRAAHPDPRSLPPRPADHSSHVVGPAPVVAGAIN